MNSSSSANATSTRELLLDAAERLFADRGVHRASVRSITAAAGSNLAAINYHFGSKEGLIEAVLARRIGPLNRRRLDLLEAVVEHSSGAPPIEEIIRAFIEPPLDMVRRQHGGHAFARFLAHSLSASDETTRRLVFEQFQEVIERFTEVIGRALPHLSAEEVHWRFHFMVGSMVHTIGFGFLAHEASRGLCHPLDLDRLTEQLVRFLAGGFRSAGAGDAA